MCIGIPMRVVEISDGRPWCEGRGRRQQLDVMLVGDVPLGSWVLAFQGCARRAITAEEAAWTNDALDALEAALAGETNFDTYFADLAGFEREVGTHAEGTNR
ncbi:MAG TPA: HypC/HybG/HupF family hydrogenase formation chaperone [Casimicrobiaceae bacterium]|nr:HypC/HybG/HupF family hydrogenase formation chaperone [Casimicrobiaceae bacterium]